MKKIYLYFFLFFLSIGCATFQTQINGENQTAVDQGEDPQQSVYLLGGLEIGSNDEEPSYIQQLKTQLNKASKQSAVLFLGDNLSVDANQKNNQGGLNGALHKQLNLVEDFQGKAIFIPGQLEWNGGLKPLELQEEAIEKALGKDSFLPKNGCAFDKLSLSDQVQLLVIDSQWFLNDWDQFPTINDNCEIRTRAKFFEEIESEIKKARGKTTLIAIHHPMYTNGPHGGRYTAASHLTPLPVLGTLKNTLRKTGGLVSSDTQNKLYRELIKRVVTLAQENEKVIFISGHEKNLQLLRKDNLVQIISGALAKTTATRNKKDEFSSSEPGFARLDFFADGRVFVSFLNPQNEQLYRSQLFQPKVAKEQKGYANEVPSRIDASVYKVENTEKSKVYKWIWGERYRKYYGAQVSAPTVNLDTLFGGLTPIRKGGGHQSKSLRLVDKNGVAYVMRAIKKSAEVYLQSMAFKNQYVIGEFEDTYTESLLEDFYTGSHPYAPFTLGTMSDAIDVYHTNPVLYYIPKQAALGDYNVDFGNELYMIEEHVSEGHNLKSFGYAKSIENTTDMLKKLRKDEKYQMDEAMYIRARLFDMVIGDWDRHVDQWRWAEFEDERTGIVTIRPIPRDRDQAYSLMGDGWLMEFATRVIPPLKLMEGFHKDIRNVKSFNASPYSLDMMLLNNTKKSLWDEQVQRIQSQLTPSVIDQGLSAFPPEVQDETVSRIKETLLARLKNLSSTAHQYYDILNRTAIVFGTDKDDLVEVERKPDGQTRIRVSRIKKEGGEVIHDRIYDHAVTKEIWVYGLDDKDEFKVFGTGNKLIKVRLIGGQNKDQYEVSNAKRLKIYDYKSKKSEFISSKGRKKLTDDYETNTFHYSKFKNNMNQLIPTVGANPDDGLKIGIADTYTTYGFERNPFTAQHNFSAAYYFATNGFELGYEGEFANVIGAWNFALQLGFTSPNYSVNFFDFGNETLNPNDQNEEQFSMDYNRVKLSRLVLAPSLRWKGGSGGFVQVGLHYASVEVEETQNRFINTYLSGNQIENTRQFFGVEAGYGFQNVDNIAFPTLALRTHIKLGYTNHLDADKEFAYVVPSISVSYPLSVSRKLIFATKLKGHFTLGNEFEFYQAATIGGDDGLRGYRNQRFTGKHSFYQSSDVRINLKKIKTGLLPMHIGVYGGADYGRVWVETDNSNTWNTSVGGGVFFNAADVISANISAFTAKEGLRIGFQMGFAF